MPLEVHMFYLLSMMLACTLSPTGEHAADSAPDTAIDTAIDTAAPEDSAASCGETAPTANIDVSIEKMVAGGGPGTILTEIWWINVSIGATDPDGDLARWTFELWRATGDEALDTDRPADSSEEIDEEAYVEETRPPCTTTAVLAGRAWVLSDDPAVSLLIPGAPYEIAVAVTDETGARSEIVSVAGVAPSTDR